MSISFGEWSIPLLWVEGMLSKFRGNEDPWRFCEGSAGPIQGAGLWSVDTPRIVLALSVGDQAKRDLVAPASSPSGFLEVWKLEYAGPE